MNTMKTALLGCLIFFIAGTASAATVIKFDLGGTGPDLKFDSGILSTVDDGDGLTAGDQNTSLEFLSFLDGSVADILNGASLSLSNVIASGATSLIGNLVLQSTTGGTFDVYSPTNTLLLSGSLGDGAIAGSTSDSTGGFFNTTIANFTSGSLLSSLASTPAGFSVSFTNIVSAAGNYLQVSANGLQSFTADATGQIEGSPVPEPATVALLLSGVLGGIARKRKMV